MLMYTRNPVFLTSLNYYLCHILTLDQPVSKRFCKEDEHLCKQRGQWKWITNRKENALVLKILYWHVVSNHTRLVVSQEKRGQSSSRFGHSPVVGASCLVLRNIRAEKKKKKKKNKKKKKKKKKK